MSNQEETANTLIDVGPGVGSKVEHIKSESNHLRGQIGEELAQDSTHFSDAQVQLIKFHGIYQQENRDARQARKAAGSEKAYQFMVRSRIPGGMLTAEQYLVEDELAGRYANGTLRITTRQGFQLHGIFKGDLHSTIHTINEALLSTLAACGDVNRNVMACPAPAANRAQAQVQEIAHRIAMHLAPRTHAYHEIWIDGEQVETETFSRLATPLCYATVDEVLPVVETIVMIQRDYGDRQNRKHARMKYVVEERGIAWFRAELERRLGHSVQDPRTISWHDVEDHLGWHTQDDGRWFLGLYVENGRIKDDDTMQLRSGLRHAIEEFRPNNRLTAQQNILITNLAETQRGPLMDLLAQYGIPTDPAEIGTRRFAMACPALPTCGLALAEAERALPTVIRQIEADLHALGLGNEPLSIRMTGCPNGCARPYMGDIGLVGRTKDIYNVYVGGDMLNTRLNSLYAASVHIRDVVATVRPLLALWRDERIPGEAFGDFCYRVGLEYLHSQVKAPA